MTRCDSIEEVLLSADIVIVGTAAKKHAGIIKDKWILENVHINAMGGDAPGKTELEKSLLLRSHIIVEYKKQSAIEGEIQQLSQEELDKVIYAELWELVSGEVSPPQDDKRITIFDYVGFALEDYSVLCLTKKLSEKYGIGQEVPLIPMLSDPKNLFSLLQL